MSCQFDSGFFGGFKFLEQVGERAEFDIDAGGHLVNYFAQVVDGFFNGVPNADAPADFRNALRVRWNADFAV